MNKVASCLCPRLLPWLGPGPSGAVGCLAGSQELSWCGQAAGREARAPACALWQGPLHAGRVAEPDVSDV